MSGARDDVDTAALRAASACAEVERVCMELLGQNDQARDERDQALAELATARHERDEARAFLAASIAALAEIRREVEKIALSAVVTAERDALLRALEARCPALGCAGLAGHQGEHVRRPDRGGR